MGDFCRRLRLPAEQQSPGYFLSRVNLGAFVPFTACNVCSDLQALAKLLVLLALCDSYLHLRSNSQVSQPLAVCGTLFKLPPLDFTTFEGMMIDKVDSLAEGQLLSDKDIAISCRCGTMSRRLLDRLLCTVALALTYSESS